MKKASAWYIMYPQDPYALGPIRFDKPVNEREIRKFVRETYEENKQRLPKGFSCWPA